MRDLDMKQKVPDYQEKKEDDREAGVEQDAPQPDATGISPE